jgi:hypothetical protein
MLARPLMLSTLLACGGQGGGTTGGTTQAADTSTSGGDSTSESPTTTGSTSGGSTTSGTAGDQADICEAQTNFGACSGAGCAGLYDTLNVADDCSQTNAGQLCIAADGTMGQTGPTRAYHRQVDGALRYLLWVDDGRTPIGWTECTDADLPLGCGCLCDCPAVFCGQPGPGC